MPSHKNHKVCFLFPYPEGIAPGQRFRYEQYTALLAQQGFTISFSPFLSLGDYQFIYTKGHSIRKTWAVLKGSFKRIILLFTLVNVDFVFLYREAAPIGPPVFEWIIAKVLQKKIIYDFDDAIWLTDRAKESWLLRVLKWRSKVQSICSWSYKVSCGNEYLCDFARQSNNRVVYNPTTIDTENLHNPLLYETNSHDNEKIIIGWTGSHSTLKYLHTIESVLQRIESKYPQVEIWVIADQPSQLKLQSLRFKPWSLETEVSDLSKVDIGIMPLPDDEWAKGKCGFKALQYMAMELPCVISPVGVNTTIVEHGVTGFLAETETEWLSFITKLIEDKLLREQIGKASRKKVVDHYSIISNQKNFLSLFE